MGAEKFIGKQISRKYVAKRGGTYLAGKTAGRLAAKAVPIINTLSIALDAATLGVMLIDAAMGLRRPKRKLAPPPGGDES